jgi:hypothetical protein
VSQTASCLEDVPQTCDRYGASLGTTKSVSPNHRRYPPLGIASGNGPAKVLIEYITELVDADTANYDNVDPLYMYNLILATYGELSDNMLTSYEELMRAPMNPIEPLSIYFERLKACSKVVRDGNVPVSDKKKVIIAYMGIVGSTNFEPYLRKWRSYYSLGRQDLGPPQSVLPQVQQRQETKRHRRTKARKIKKHDDAVATATKKNSNVDEEEEPDQPNVLSRDPMNTIHDCICKCSHVCRSNQKQTSASGYQVRYLPVQAIRSDALGNYVSSFHTGAIVRPVYWLLEQGSTTCLFQLLPTGASV